METPLSRFVLWHCLHTNDPTNITVIRMTANQKVRYIAGGCGSAGFVLCAWFSYLCGLAARGNASRAYALWLSPGTASQQYHDAARQNALWTVAMTASVLLAILCLSSGFYAHRAVIWRKGLGLLLICGSCMPSSFAFGILSQLLNIGGRTIPPARITGWSSGGITLQGWQMHAGAALFASIALFMVAWGIRLLRRPGDD
jgi:hypothetical protein